MYTFIPAQRTAGSAYADTAEGSFMFELTDEQFTRHYIAPDDMEAHGESLGGRYYVAESVQPKYNCVAAAIMDSWTSIGSQDADCGTCDLGNGWHALFVGERAILHADSAGFVTAWRLDAGDDIDQEWEKIEAKARYDDYDEEDQEEDENA